MGLGHATAKELPKVWCIRHVTIDQWVQYGTARLMRNNQVVFEATCRAGQLPDRFTTSCRPHQANPGRTLRYVFECYDDPITLENECDDATQEGAVITIDYENFDAP